MFFFRNRGCVRKNSNYISHLMPTIYSLISILSPKYSPFTMSFISYLRDMEDDEDPPGAKPPLSISTPKR